mgnify:CR=1 FL=1
MPAFPLRPLGTDVRFRPIADIAGPRQIAAMRRAFKGYALLALTLSACEKDIPRSQMPHFATLCVPRTKWNDLLAEMKHFGARNGLELHGGVEAFPARSRFSMPILREATVTILATISTCGSLATHTSKAR